jgi:hypothetical protein
LADGESPIYVLSGQSGNQDIRREIITIAIGCHTLAAGDPHEAVNGAADF